MAWGPTRSEQSNSHGDQPAAMHQRYENDGNVPYSSQESPLQYSAESQLIREFFSKMLEMQQNYEVTIDELRLERHEMQQNYEKTIDELRSERHEMQQNYERIIDELRSERHEMKQNYERTIEKLRLEMQEMQQNYEKDAKERGELVAKLKKEMTEEREEHLKKMKQLDDKLASSEDYARRLKNRNLFRRFFNLEPK